jgi:hypothetical protein
MQELKAMCIDGTKVIAALNTREFIRVRIKEIRASVGYR